MNKLRKIAAWLWRVKERIVLATMVAILCHRVYKVINPDVEDPGKPYVLPGSNPPPPETMPDWPGQPPAPPSPPREEVVSTLWNYNMFQYTPGGRSGGADSGPSVDITVIRVTEDSRGPRAQVRTGQNVRYWVSEGDVRESFEVREVDPDGCDGRGSVTILDQSTNQFETICKE